MKVNLPMDNCVSLESELLKTVIKFAPLGSIIHDTGDCTVDAKSRTDQTSADLSNCRMETSGHH